MCKIIMIIFDNSELLNWKKGLYIIKKTGIWWINIIAYILNVLMDRS